MTGTAVEVVGGQTGYTAVVDRDTKREFKAKKQSVACLPGHIILFRESLLYGVRFFELDFATAGVRGFSYRVRVRGLDWIPRLLT